MIARAVGGARVASMPIDIVENYEGRSGVLKGRVTRAEGPLPGVSRGLVAGRRFVDVVVARTVVPGKAGRAEHLPVTRIKGKVVENHVAVVDAEHGASADDVADNVVAEVGELGSVGGLRVCHEHGLELGAL